MSERDPEPVWDQIVMPAQGMFRGPRGGEGMPVHFCRFSDEWTVFVVQEGTCCAEHSLCNWTLSYKGREVVSGHLPDLDAAKGLAVRCLETLISFDPDLSSPEPHHAVLGGFDPGDGFGGSGGFNPGAH